MRIGILTLFHENYNWGGVLQGYALKRYLEQEYEGVHADILRYHSGTNIVYKNKVQQAMQYSPQEIADRVGKKVGSKLFRQKQKGYDLSTRKALFDTFMAQFTSNALIYHDSTLHFAAEDYDVLICGSDQVWNPNVARPGYFLTMIEDQCVKVAYAASIARDDLSEHEKEVMIPLIEKFNHVSVREKTAKDFLSIYVSQETSILEVLDPSMMIEKEQWMELASDCDVAEDAFALAFFFSDSLEYRKMVESYCKEAGLRLKFIPFAKEALEHDLIGPGDPITDVGPKEFIALFRDAKMVFTDSFHGSVFSILFEKPFFVFERDKQTKVSKNSRLYDLLAKFKVSDRLISSEGDFYHVLKQDIPYDRIQTMLKDYRQASKQYLDECILDGINRGEKKVQREKERDTIDQLISPYKDAYIGYCDKMPVRRASSSGGLFFYLAYRVLQMGGIIYGAAYTNTLEVVHKRVCSKAELRDLLGSKYVQSKMGNCMSQIAEDLEHGKRVLFSGTPCQVLGIKNYLTKRKISMEELILVDFICHGVPSPELWRSYLMYQGKDIAIMKANFRDKSKGWHDYQMRLTFEDGKCYKESHDLDPYMRTFLSDKNLRPSCYLCLTKDAVYASDLTLGDAWKIEKEKSEWADDKGTSLFVVRSDKGRNLLETLEKDFHYAASDYEKWGRMNPSLKEPTHMPGERKAFFADFRNLTGDDFWEKYSKINRKAQLRYQTKKLIKKSGLEKAVRKII